jgi:hypothetical protein
VTAAVPSETAPSDQPTLRLALLLGQLAVLLLTVRVFELENRAVYFMLVAAVAGFAIHAALPLAYRLPFFAALSISAVVAVLGLVPGLAVLALGFSLIAICHLPGPVSVRGTLLLALGAVLWLLRSSSRLGGLPSVAIPVLASMFMFRLVIYFQAIHQQQAPRSLIWSAAYLFVLPNVCYPLFPVVDYGTFIRTHFDADHFRIYDRGIRYMLRGITHLLVYRLMFYEVVLDSGYLNNLSEVCRYVVGTFLLYVKVSGQFHLIMGLLGLFGFRLPETNHLYFLASSPTDFWRRINIYWKDFMLKLAYYPSFFWLRRYGNTVAVAAATMIVFLVTWLLHAYQFYWLQGGPLLTSRDVAFWGIFGVLVLLVTLWETRPNRPAVRRTDRSWSLARGASTVLTFAIIAVLWSLWNAASFSTWTFMWAQTRYSTPMTWVVLGAAVVGGVMVAGVGWGSPTLEGPRLDREPVRATARRALGRILVMGLLMMTQAPALNRRLPPHLALVADHLRAVGFSPASVASAQAGYYEQLVQGEPQVARPWEVPIRNDRDWNALLRDRRDFLTIAMIPSDTTTFIGARFTTNAWGMRGPAYTLTKPPATYRIAFLGPSDVMGWGVADSEALPVVVQKELHPALLSLTANVEQVQVLNFGIPSYGLAQQVVRLQWEGLRFSPDLILLTVHPYDLVHLQENLQTVLAQGYDIPDPDLTRILARVGLGPGLHGTMADLRVVEEDVDRWAFRRAEQLATSIGASVAVVALRTPDALVGGNLATTRRAAEATHMPFLDCTGVWDSVDVRSYWLSPEDGHPNAAGYRLMSACLLDRLRQDSRYRKAT